MAAVLAVNEGQLAELRDRLAAAEAAQQVAVAAAVAQTEARYSKKLVKVEAKLMGVVSAVW